jgi:hypothetical protein
MLNGRSSVMPIFTQVSLAASLAIVGAAVDQAQQAALADAVAQPGVAAMIQTFEDYPLVAIGEGHRNQQVHDFIVMLVRDRRFLPSGGDIVVEFGNARYQGVIDRYIAGEPVGSADVARAWRDAMNILVWDAPVYGRFFATVRAVNRTRAPAARLRVVLADPPIDWTSIHDRTAWEQFVAVRDSHAAQVIEHEVLSKGHRALLIFGSGHVDREKAFEAYGSPLNRPHVPNLAELLEERHPGATLLVWSHMAGWTTSELDGRLTRWPRPALARLRGTWLGAAHVGPPQQTPRLEDLADAFLYLGSTASLTNSTPAPRLYRDPVYLRELLRRNAIQGGANTAELERLKARYLRGGQ